MKDAIINQMANDCFKLFMVGIAIGACAVGFIVWIFL